MKFAFLAACLMLSGCGDGVGKNDHQASGTISKQGNDLAVRSNVPGLRITKVANLPVNPTPSKIDDYCDGYHLKAPMSAGGKLAARNGWIVKSETKLGRLDAITFVGKLLPATSATCVHQNGNLAIFDGSRLLAIVYMPRNRRTDPDDMLADDGLGYSLPVGSDRIRLYRGLPAPPLADIVLNGGISVEPTAKEDSVCSGAAKVPNVFGKDIRIARAVLGSSG